MAQREDKPFIGERLRGNRSINGITEAQFARAVILSTQTFEHGIVKHIAIRDLTIVEIYVLPSIALKSYVMSQRDENPEVFA